MKKTNVCSSHNHVYYLIKHLTTTICSIAIQQNWVNISHCQASCNKYWAIACKQHCQILKQQSGDHSSQRQQTNMNQYCTQVKYMFVGYFHIKCKCKMQITT